MDVFEAIERRRSIKRFTDRVVSRDDIQRLLDAAVLAPNHKMTEPWEFVVLGPAARRAFGDVLGGRKARKIEDAAAGAAVREKVAREHESLPAMIAVVVSVSEDAERREEDYAAAWMAIENLSLAAVAQGLGTHIKTGAVMDDPGARGVLGIEEGKRIIATINVGEPAELPSGKQRTPAAAKTQWLD